MFLNIKDITVDQKYQSRISLDLELVQTYADLMRDGVRFPPVTVVLVDKATYVLVDGFHRYQATSDIDEYEIEADVITGTWRDVWLGKWKANTAHGKPLSRMEKRRLVLEMLSDDECVKWSNRQIGKHVGVSHTFVSALRTPESGNVATPPVEKKPVPAAKPEPSGNVATPAEPDEGPSEQEVMIETLAEENAELTKKLAMAVLPAEEKEAAGQLIDDLRAEIKLLRVELESVKASRDRYQWENAELKKQVAAQQRQLKKLQG